jgi:hypothetical protein
MCTAKVALLISLVLGPVTKYLSAALWAAASRSANTKQTKLKTLEILGCQV